MCDKCEEFEAKIQRYRWFTTQGLDALTVKRINQLIDETRRRKDAVHPADGFESDPSTQTGLNEH
jgi:hypothetical protein